MKHFKNIKAESHSAESLEKAALNSSFASFDNDDVYQTRLTHSEVQEEILKINAAIEVNGHKLPVMCSNHFLVERNKGARSSECGTIAHRKAS